MASTVHLRASPYRLRVFFVGSSSVGYCKQRGPRLGNEMIESGPTWPIHDFNGLCERLLEARSYFNGGLERCSSSSGCAVVETSRRRRYDAGTFAVLVEKAADLRAVAGFKWVRTDSPRYANHGASWPRLEASYMTTSRTKEHELTAQFTY